MVNIKLGILEMVEKARAVIEEVDVEDAIAEARDPDCLIIDVRDIKKGSETAIYHRASIVLGA